MFQHAPTITAASVPVARRSPTSDASGSCWISIPPLQIWPDWPAKACKSNISLLGFDVCYHFQGKANVLWRSPDHVRCSCSFLAWQSEVCCSSIWGFPVFVFNKVCWQSEASELKPPVMNHFMSPNIGLSMQRKLLRPFINNWRWNSPQS